MKIHGTAKGGAISKKDFGVAFGGGEPVEVTCSNADEGMTGDAGLWSDNENFHGIALNGTSSCLFDKTITTITIELKRQGSTTDQFYYRIYNSSDNQVATTAGVAQSTLSTSPATLELDLISSHKMADGDRIGIFFDGGSETNAIRSTKSGTVKDANGYLGVVLQGGTWTTDNIYQGYVVAVGT